METLGIIPARGGSKRIPRKNLKSFAGAPLIWHSINSARQSNAITRIVVTTEDEEIFDYCKSIDPDLPFLRPEDLANDDTPTLPVIQNVVSQLQADEGYKPDVIVVLQPTSPLRTKQHIDEASSLFLSSEVDSVVSVVEIPHQFTPFSAMQVIGDKLVFCDDHPEIWNVSQKKPNYFARNGCFNSICSYHCLTQKNSLYGDSIAPYLMAPEASVDIDDNSSWQFAEYCFYKK